MVASAAYRAGEKLHSEYYGEDSNYTNKGGVIYTEIFLPPHVPREYADRETLWNAVEKVEKGKKAQLAYEDAFRKALGAKRSAEVKKDLAAKKRTLQKSENRLAELDRLFKRIYEDMVNGKLSEARFQMLSDDYEQEQADLRAKIEMLENEIQNQEDQAENVDRFIRQAKKYLYLEKLTPTILNDMVNAVYVHAPDKSSGHRVQDVTISYNYIGILPANLLYDVMNGKAA